MCLYAGIVNIFNYEYFLVGFLKFRYTANMINPNFIYLGFILQLIGGADYFIGTIKGKFQPNKVSWFLWSVAPLLAFSAELQKGVGIQSLTTFVSGFVPLSVFIVSFLNKKAYWKIEKFDYLCGGLSVLGLIMWIVTKEGNVAILFAILADGLAGIPTVIKSFKEPESEGVMLYLFSMVNTGMTLFTITIWNFEHYAFPAYLTFLNLLLTVLIATKIGTRFKLAKVLKRRNDD